MPESSDEINARIVASFDSVQVSVALFDADDVLVYHNEHYRRAYRCFEDYESLIGRSFTELLRGKLAYGEIAGRLARDDPERWISMRVARRRNPDAGPAEILLTDGRWLQINERVSETGDTICAYQDITQKKKTDHQLHEVLEGRQHAFALWDTVGRLILRNAAFIDLLETTKGAGLATGASVAAVFARASHNFDTNGVMGDVWGAARRTAQDTPVSQELIRHRDGRAFMVTDRRTGEGGVATIVADVTEAQQKEASALERCDEINGVANELEVSKDALERHSADLVYMVEEMAVANAQLEAASVNKAHFLGMVSHELRTPMNAIIGFSEIIKDELLGPIGNAKYLEYAGDVYDGAEHLLALVNVLLDMSKIEAGRWDINVGAVDVVRILDSCLRMMRQNAEQKSMVLDLSCDDDLPMVEVDAKSFRQIILNLLSNAIKFSYEKGRVGISARLRGEFVEFTIVDNGIGMPSADIERVLLPFEQLDNELTRTYEGTELGLTMCQSLMDLHGGALEITSAVGEATSVKFKFKRASCA
ncbi:MAG: two-component system cell cycle sensor histidine kinase PleC [Alphaproteobacteria bacterium]|jgi:two-component system cell cycle sensor histidine kinase PleC